MHHSKRKKATLYKEKRGERGAGKSQRRTKQRRLRKKSLALCKGRCVVSGYNNAIELQAAHIVPRSIGLQFNFKYVDHHRNIIPLNSGLHLLFDKFQWTFDIFSFIDNPSDSDKYFYTRILPISPALKMKCSLKSVARKQIKIHKRYFAALYLHYMVFMYYNFTERSCRRDVAYYFQLFSDNDFFHKLVEASSVAQLREVCASQRKETDYTHIVGHRNRGEIIEYLTCWSYYPYDRWSWEQEESIGGETLDNYKKWNLM